LKDLAHGNPGLWIFLLLQEVLCLVDQPFLFVTPVMRTREPPADRENDQQTDDNDRAWFHPALFSQRRIATASRSGASGLRNTPRRGVANFVLHMQHEICTGF